MVKTIWSNDQVRPGPEHGDNQHHSQNQQIQQCTQHCSHVQSHYQFTLSQNITTSCYCSTTSLDRTLPTYCLAEWRPRPPSMKLCVVSMELWARHMSRHCLVGKIVSYLGPDFPLFHGYIYECCTYSIFRSKHIGNEIIRCNDPCHTNHLSSWN